MDIAFHPLLPSSSSPCWTPTSSWSSCPLTTTYPWKNWIRLSWFTPTDQHPMWTVHMCSVTTSDPAWVDGTHTSVFWVHQLELSGKVWVTCWAPNKGFGLQVSCSLSGHNLLGKDVCLKWFPISHFSCKHTSVSLQNLGVKPVTAIGMFHWVASSVSLTWLECSTHHLAMFF